MDGEQALYTVAKNPLSMSTELPLPWHAWMKPWYGGSEYGICTFDVKSNVCEGILGCMHFTHAVYYAHYFPS